MGSGKLIKAAIQKYGKKNFIKEIIQVFDNREDAEKLEAHIVNKEFTLRSDTYNINIGGNVRIAFKENNGFYGKKHTSSSLNKMRLKKLGNKNSRAHFFLIKGILARGYKQAAQLLGITKSISRNVFFCCGNPTVDACFLSAYQQLEAEKAFASWQKQIEVKKELLSRLARERFTGYIWSEERNAKISAALKGRKLSEERVNKVNKNPEKIQKTAEKHRGMKRSVETRQRISLSKQGKPASNKGKIRIKSSDGISQLWPKDSLIPEGFVKIVTKKAVNSFGKYKMLDKDTILEEGWSWVC
jgi:hypothetical protein